MSRKVKRNQQNQKKITIAAEWQSYRTGVMPPEVSHIQLQETRRAFYAGAAILLSIMNKLGSDNFSEDAAAKILDAIDAELKDFASRVGTDY